MLISTFFHHYLFSKRSGSLTKTIARLCVLGVGVGIMSLILVLNIMNAFNKSIRMKQLAVEPHLVVQTSKDSQTNKVKQFFKDHPEVTASSFESQDVIIRTVDGTFSGAMAWGLEQTTMTSMLKRIQKASHGQTFSKDFFKDDLDKFKKNEIFLGVDLARTLGIYEGDLVTVIPPEAILLPLGEIPVFDKAVVKLLLLTQIESIDSHYLYYNKEDTFRRLSNSSSFEKGWTLRVPSPDDFAQWEKPLEATGAKVASWEERNSTLFFALKMEKMAMGLFLGLSALITGFSIITVLVLLMAQKKKETGLLMALGYSPRKIRRLFLALGMLLSTLGIGGGAFVGILGSYLLKVFPLDVLPDIYYDSTVAASIEMPVILFILGMAFGLAFFGCWLSVQLNLRWTPSEGLRGAR